MLVTFALVVAGDIASAQSNLPIGLPSDQMVPLKLDGYRLVKLDRTKEVVFDFGPENKKLTAVVPLFIYLPERDQASEMREGLRAIHDQLARLAAQKHEIDPAQILTVFLALDRILSQGELPVNMDKPAPGGGPKNVPSAIAGKPVSSAGEVNPLERAISANKK